MVERADELSADACIWEGGGRNASGDPLIYLGLKGLLYVELSSKKLSGDAHSSFANDPAERAMAAAGGAPYAARGRRTGVDPGLLR